MEESIWMYVGIISVLIAVGILASILSRYQTDNAEQMLFDSLFQLKAQADQVCKAPEQTMLSITVTLPAEAKIYAKDNRLCAVIKDKIRCQPTDCVIPDSPAILDLAGASELFKTHQYTCAFLNDGDLIITCQG